MQFVPTELSGAFLIHPRVFSDERGFFMETYHADKFAEAGINLPFRQDNHSRSSHGTLRGLHYQVGQPQGKLVRVVQGEVWDVAVDLRRSSPTFGKWCGWHLSAANKQMVYIPPQFAHGFCVLSETAEFVYKCTDTYAPAQERCIVWNDPTLAIPWPVQNPLVSPRDSAGIAFTAAPYFD